ncbi:MAG: hypothetical protein R3F37_03620 [Candidatus Competibacteraceae bacterium]
MAQTRTQFGFQLISGGQETIPELFILQQSMVQSILHKGLFILASAYIKSIDIRTTFGFYGATITQLFLILYTINF